MVKGHVGQLSRIHLPLIIASAQLLAPPGPLGVYQWSRFQGESAQVCGV